jgi:hypothetical protein
MILTSLKALLISVSDYIAMGQGTSHLNWVCSCEDGKFNLSATYKEQKLRPTETTGKQSEILKQEAVSLY